MRIDGANSLRPHDPSGAAKPPQDSSRPSGAADARKTARDSEIESMLAPYLRAAMAGEEIDEQAVAEARRLLQSGQLDTPEGARRAAEALMRLGI